MVTRRAFLKKAAAVGAVVALLGTQASAQNPAASVTTPLEAPKTPWGEPDLQGIWKDEFDTPGARHLPDLKLRARNR